MKRITLFIIICFAGILGTAITMFGGQNWACMIATIIFIPGIALSLELYLKERREKEEKLYAELMAKDNALNDFIKYFSIDRSRAEIFYQSGFHSLDDFKGKNVEELMIIDEINPTLAKRIVNRMERAG
jgi:hypothetical protein